MVPPLVPTPRVLVPGQSMTVRTPARLPLGDRIVVYFADRASPRATVGTVAEVLPGDGGADFTRVRGTDLVEIGPDGSLRDLDEVRSDRAPMQEVENALRAYMRARAESGLGGDVFVTLATDPVLASHQVASALEISSPELQELLEAGDAAERLQRGLAMLRRETLLLVSTMAKGA